MNKKSQLIELRQKWMFSLIKISKNQLKVHMNSWYRYESDRSTIFQLHKWVFHQETIDSNSPLNNLFDRNHHYHLLCPGIYKYIAMGMVSNGQLRREETRELQISSIVCKKKNEYYPSSLWDKTKLTYVVFCWLYISKR